MRSFHPPILRLQLAGMLLLLPASGDWSAAVDFCSAAAFPMTHPSPGGASMSTGNGNPSQKLAGKRRSPSCRQLPSNGPPFARILLHSRPCAGRCGKQCRQRPDMPVIGAATAPHNLQTEFPLQSGN